MSYQHSWQYLNEFINMKIAQADAVNKMYLCKVTESLGYYVSVKFVTENEDATPITNIPVIQSKYHSIIVQPNDIGILINLGQSFGAYLEGKETAPITQSNYYVFLPLLTKSEYQGSADAQKLCSPDLSTSLEIADDGITILAVKQVSIEAEDVTIKATNPISFGTSDELGAVLAEFIDAVSQAMTTPTSPGSPATLDPSVIAQLSQIKAKLAQVLKS